MGRMRSGGSLEKGGAVPSRTPAAALQDDMAGRAMPFRLGMTLC